MYEANDFKSKEISWTRDIFWGCLSEERQFKNMTGAWRISWPFSHLSFARTSVMDLKWIMRELIIWTHSLQFLLLVLPLHLEITGSKQYAILWVMHSKATCPCWSITNLNLIKDTKQRKEAPQGWNMTTLVRQKITDWGAEAGSSSQLQTCTCERVTPGSPYTQWRPRKYHQGSPRPYFLSKS